MTEKRRLPKLESIQRISKIPVVETSFNIATGLYGKIKHSNKLIQWGFGTVEGVTNYAIDTSLIALPLIELPLAVVDNIVCKGLDTVQQRVPAINYPPEKIIGKTKSYVSENIVQPVLKRADSVKQFSLNGAELAATRIDTALNVADQYVDKYLPDATDVDKGPENSGESKTIQTIVHANRLSRKLQRRLTKRTIAEARALQKQGLDTVQILLKLAEMMVKDPKQFSAKMKELWINLSQDEPENQVPPANIEQLIAMITRESARRFVHLTNFSVSTAYKLPGYTAHTIQFITHEANKLIDQVLKTVHLEGAKAFAVTRTQIQLQNLNSTLRDVQQLIENLVSKLLTRQNPKAKFQENSVPLHTLSPVAQSPERTPENRQEPKPIEVNNQKKTQTPKQNENPIPQPNQNENTNQINHNQQQTTPSPKKQRKAKTNSLSSSDISDVNSNNQPIINGELKNNTE